MLYEETFMLKTPVPVILNLADSIDISVGVANVAGQIYAIAINDNARKIGYTWIKSTQYPNGYWINNMAPNSYTNAPAGQQPMVTPGSGNLTIGFAATNIGSVTGTLTLQTIVANTVLQSASFTVDPMGTNASIQYVGTMPQQAYIVTLKVTP